MTAQPDIRAALAAHDGWVSEVDPDRSNSLSVVARYRCQCGKVLDDTSEGPFADDRHRAHLTDDVLAPLLDAARAQGGRDALYAAAQFGTMPGKTWPETLRDRAGRVAP